jgi:RNA polymerase sigma-70 factor (ECF subfamily)
MPGSEAIARRDDGGPTAAATVADRGLVEDALARLPDAQRRVIELAFFEGLTQTEIAERLAEPLGTVKTRARLGLERLRTALRAEGQPG